MTQQIQQKIPERTEFAQSQLNQAAQTIEGNAQVYNQQAKAEVTQGV